MLEALAAVSLAGNILQFISFAGEVFSKACKIRDKGTLGLKEELEIAIDNLELSTCKLHPASTSKVGVHTALNQDEHVRYCYDVKIIPLTRH